MTRGTVSEHFNYCLVAYVQIDATREMSEEPTEMMRPAHWERGGIECCRETGRTTARAQGGGPLWLRSVCCQTVQVV